MTRASPPATLRQSITVRLFQVSFRSYAVIAIALTALLVAGEFVSTRAALRREMTTYQHAFDSALATALWAMDTDKLDTILTGMVEIPEIVGVRISDPATGHLFGIALGLPGGVAVGRDDRLERQWSEMAQAAVVRHDFDIVFTHATGAAMVGRAELLSGRHELIARIRGQSTLIVAISLFKEAVLWGIFLVVGRRMLVRPLTELIGALDTVAPDDPGRIGFPPATEPIIAGTELMVVRDSFNALIDRVHEHRAQLIALNAGLEHQVAERTQALEDANRALREQAQRLSASNTELEQFAYVASHDLRQPLRMVNSYLTLLDRGYADRLDAEARQYIAFAREGASRMDRLILDLLALSRIGRLARPFEPTVLSLVVSRALATLKDELDAAGATVSSPPDLPVVWGDADELTRLMTNLVGNAVKYRAADRPPVITIGWRLDADGAPLVWVKDNGIGISPEDFDRVFLIFQRLHTRAEYEGTGIGLAICKKIVERHGGHIRVESTAGEGSTFSFSLAAAPEATGPVP